MSTVKILNEFTDELKLLMFKFQSNERILVGLFFPYNFISHHQINSDLH